ncbi:hypothetical protein [Parapedobacter sp. 2B3]
MSVAKGFFWVEAPRPVAVATRMGLRDTANPSGSTENGLTVS